MPGSRTRGRPRMTRMGNITAWIGPSMGELVWNVEDWNTWRTFARRAASDRGKLTTATTVCEYGITGSPVDTSLKADPVPLIVVIRSRSRPRCYHNCCLADVIQRRNHGF